MGASEQTRKTDYVYGTVLDIITFPHGPTLRQDTHRDVFGFVIIPYHFILHLLKST